MNENNKEKGHPTQNNTVFKRLPMDDSVQNEDTQIGITLLLVKSKLTCHEGEHGRKRIVVKVGQRCHNRQHDDRREIPDYFP